ncbi:MAG: urate oxidase [Verrucomicrobiota bacterium]|jgi:urate oxidase
MKLISQRYGKARVRLLKVSREGTRHDLKEIEASVMLEGNFDSTYTAGDNSLVVATDTMKNTVYALAKDQLGSEIERFACVVGNHFLSRYPQVSRATVRLAEHPWTRLMVDGHPHSHAFAEGNRARPFTEAACGRDACVVESGVEDLLILKSTGSGFAGFIRDEFTTLPETKDRILATRMKAGWRFSSVPGDYAESNRRALDAMLKVFATRHSASVQATLHDMAGAALEAVSEIDLIRLCMPNQHCLLVNLAAFEIENSNEIFVPTEEPHGQIEAVLSRA